MDEGDSSLCGRSQRPTPISRLCAEIITRILEELQHIEPQALTTARQVCRAFNDLATPLAYKTIHINEQITHLSAEILFPHALRNMHIHTRDIVLRSGLDRDSVALFLNNLQKLRSVRYICLPLLSETPGSTIPDLRWSFICNTGPAYDRWVPSDIYSLTSRDPSSIRIHIEGLPVGALDGKHADLYRSVIPSNLLVSLETTIQLTASEPHLPCLKELLLESRSLEIFRYRGSGKGTRFYFGRGERRLPAFKELTLRSYEWTHGVEETACHWDFSRIRSLELVAVSVFNFLSSVCLDDFRGLHTLRVDDSGADRDREDRDNINSNHGGRGCSKAAAVSIMVHSLIRDHIHSLTSLELITQFDLFPIDALLRHSSTLRELVFRDHGAFSDEYLPCPTLRLTDLRKLSRNMNFLQSLELDMDIRHKYFTRFLTLLCRFPQLRCLTLNIQTVVEESESSWFSSSARNTSSWNGPLDPDEKCANKIFEVLKRQKRIVGHGGGEGGGGGGVVPVEWENITIKVGGWQSLMVRRVGEIWRALNKRGVFAKRCFVMERAGVSGSGTGTGTGGTIGDNGGSGSGQDRGEYVIREQRYVEMRLGRGHPWPG